VVRPIYAGLESFWDGVYATFWSDSYLSSAVAFGSAPKWNFGFLSASLVLALVPTAALLVGSVLAIRRVLVDGNPVWLIALACVGAYVLALVHHVLTLPYHCAVKAFYTVGAIPAYILLAAAGFELLSRHIVGRIVVHGGVACWAVSVVVAYFAQR
jgi:hypothetical protein